MSHVDAYKCSTVWLDDYFLFGICSKLVPSDKVNALQQDLKFSESQEIEYCG